MHAIKEKSMGDKGPDGRWQFFLISKRTERPENNPGVFLQALHMSGVEKVIPKEEGDP